MRNTKGPRLTLKVSEHDRRTVHGFLTGSRGLDKATNARIEWEGDSDSRDQLLQTQELFGQGRRSRVRLDAKAVHHSSRPGLILRHYQFDDSWSVQLQVSMA